MGWDLPYARGKRFAGAACISAGSPARILVVNGAAVAVGNSLPKRNFGQCRLYAGMK